jgi:ribosomal protein S18 acetylase RimI-like enzyme
MTTSLIEVRGAETDASRPPRGSRVKAYLFERDAIAERLDFGLATDRHTLDQAFRLQHDQYVAQGYMDSHPSGWRLSVHNALPSTRVFVARDNDRVVATVAVIVDSPLGLPMAEIYEDELRGFRGPRHNLAEVSGLAVHPDHQKSGLAILLRLIRMVLLYSIQMADLSDLCIAVNPHHAAFYRKVFNFQTIGDRKYYGKVNGAPALALQLDLDLLRTFISDLRDGRPVESEVYTFLFSPGAAEPAMARLEADLTQTFPQLGDVKYFFSRHEVGNKLSAGERAYLEECWRSLASPKAHTSQLGTVDSPGIFEPRLDLAFA